MERRIEENGYPLSYLNVFKIKGKGIISLLFYWDF